MMLDNVFAFHYMPSMGKKIFLTEILSNIIKLHKIIISSDTYIYSLNIVLSMNLRISKNPLSYKITRTFHAV